LSFLFNARKYLTDVSLKFTLFAVFSLFDRNIQLREWQRDKTIAQLDSNRKEEEAKTENQKDGTNPLCNAREWAGRKKMDG
jgi:hypothetical protein